MVESITGVWIPGQYVISRNKIDRLNDDRNNEILEQTYTHIETRRSLEDDDIDYGIQVHATTAFRKCSTVAYIGMPGEEYDCEP